MSSEASANAKTTKAKAKARKGSALEAIVVHAVLLFAVAYALYPVLWVVTLALSPSGGTEARVLPIPRGAHDITLDNFRLVMGTSDPERSWLFARQVINSLVVSFATAATAVA